MNILIANLKHLYQRRSMLIIELCFGLAAYGILITIISKIGMNISTGFFVATIWILTAGMYITSLPIEILTKPFSYCLPKHRNVPRKFLFSVGIVLSFLWSLVFLFLPDLNLLKAISACISAFSIFTIFYWLGTWITLRIRNMVITFVVFSLIAFIAKTLKINLSLVNTIIQNPFLMLPSAIIVNYSAWKYWGRSNLTRQYCDTLSTCLFGGSINITSTTKAKSVAKLYRKYPDTRCISPYVEDFFVTRINHAGTTNLKKCILGALYKAFGLMFSHLYENWGKLLIIMSLLICFACYVMENKIILIGLILPLSTAFSMHLDIKSNFLFSGGRQERFWSTLTVAAAETLFCSAEILLFAVITKILAMFMPLITIKGHDFTFNIIHLNLSLLPLIIIPIVLITKIIFYKNDGLVLFITMLIGYISFFAVVLLTEYSVINWLTFAAIAIPFSWITFIATLRHLCMRTCLTK